LAQKIPESQGSGIFRFKPENPLKLWLAGSRCKPYLRKVPFLFILLLVGSAFALPVSPDTVRVLVHSNARFDLSGLYMARENGYYRQANIYLELVEVAPQRDLVPLLLAGNGDFAITSPSFLRDFARGAPLVSLLPLYQHSPNVLVTQPAIHSLSDLKKQWIALPPGTSLGPQLMLTEHGLLPDSVRILDRAPFAREFFAAGSIAAYSVHAGKETLSLMGDSIPFNVISPDLHGVDFYGDCLIGQEKQMDMWLDRTNRFMHATQMGYGEVFLDLQEAAIIVQRQLTEPVSLPELLYEAEMFRYFNTDGRLQFGEQSMRRWEAMLRHLQDRDMVRGDISLEGMVVSSKVMRQAHTNQQKRFWLWIALASFAGVIFLVVFNLRLRRSVRLQTSELRISQDRLELALHSASDGVWERPDHRDDGLWMSSRVYDMLGIVSAGYKPSYSGFCSFVHRDDVLQLRLAQGTALNGNGRFEVEMRINTVRGWRWFRLRGGVQDNGKGGRRVSGVLQDIHDSRMAIEALKKNEARLRQYFEVGLVGVAMLDREGCVVHVNTVLASWLGLPERQCLGRNWRELTHPEDVALEEMLFDEMRRGKRDAYRLDKRMLRVPNNTVWHALVALRAIDGDGDFGGGNIVMTVLDITERQAAEAEQDRLTRMLTLKNRTLETTLYAISHDFRKPLERLENHVASLRNEMHGEVPQSQGIETELQFLDKMLKALLKLSRLGSAQSDYRQIDVTVLANAVAQEMSAQVDEAGAELCVFGLPPCRGDEIQLYQVFENLIDNSLRFRDPARQCSIVISGEECADRLEYHVRDNGCGVSPHNLQQAFTPFYRTASPVEGREGLGVGLAIVARIVENHGGSVHIASEQGKWTEVTFSLPR